LPDVLRKAMAAPAYAERLKGIDPAEVTDRTALARLPVLRKADLPTLQKASPRHSEGLCRDQPDARYSPIFRTVSATRSIWATLMLDPEGRQMPRLNSSSDTDSLPCGK
jgi:hypothetical protein